jgi:hypothetical protein
MSGVSALSSRPVPVVADWAEQRAVLVRTLTGGLEVIMDELVGAWVQRQIPRLLAFAGNVEMEHPAPRVSKL